MNCEFCQKEFAPRDSRQKYCCADCRKSARKLHYIKNRKENETREKYLFICNQCNQQFVSYNTNGKNQFCSKTCRGKARKEKTAREEIRCKQCNKKFIARVYQQKKFCSSECCNIYRRKNSKKITSICHYCGKEYVHYKSRNKKCCSNSCAAKFRGSKRKGIKLVPYKTLICEHCGKEYELLKSYLKIRNSRFCSIKCRGESKSLSMRGENNWNWIGGAITHYGENWSSQKKKTQERDNNICQICGYVKGGNILLDVHHIKKFREFNGDWKSANRLSNLICLCRMCHKKVEMGKLKCPTPKENTF